MAGMIGMAATLDSEPIGRRQLNAARSGAVPRGAGGVACGSVSA